LPDYQRPVVGEVVADLAEIPQAISVTGPWRVGKSTAVKQVISRLIKEKQVNPKQILYFSFDDPEVFASEETQRIIFDLLVEHTGQSEKMKYFFLDEIQRLPRWELFIKKYYDLKRPVRFIVSGSASSPIFRSSQESLLGRIKDRHLLPFSFREYCQYHLRKEKSFSQILAQCNNLRFLLLEGDGSGALECLMQLHGELKPFQAKIDKAVVDYCREGGFPEVWELADPVRKIEYLMEQQVRKVLYEDLMALIQYRKPENVLRFFVYLLANPGVEINATKIASDAGVERRVVEENLPRLEMTDLILRIQKFSHSPLRVRQGNIKCYPVDMALRNAVLKS
jgi:predicted AAA+ superfamily ATPase